jgi:hypothetical protein
LLFYNPLDLNNQKILWLPSIYEFERRALDKTANTATVATAAAAAMFYFAKSR